MFYLVVLTFADDHFIKEISFKELNSAKAFYNSIQVCDGGIECKSFSRVDRISPHSYKQETLHCDGSPAFIERYEKFCD